MHNIRYCMQMQFTVLGFCAGLENRQLNAEVFLWVLPEVVQKLCALAGKLVDVRGRLVDAVVKSFIRHELAQSAFAGLSICDNGINAACRRIEFRDSVP